MSALSFDKEADLVTKHYYLLKTRLKEKTQ